MATRRQTSYVWCVLPYFPKYAALCTLKIHPQKRGYGLYTPMIKLKVINKVDVCISCQKGGGVRLILRKENMVRHMIIPSSKCWIGSPVDLPKRKKKKVRVDLPFPYLCWTPLQCDVSYSTLDLITQSCEIPGEWILKIKWECLSM